MLGSISGGGGPRKNLVSSTTVLFGGRYLVSLESVRNLEALTSGKSMVPCANDTPQGFEYCTDTLVLYICRRHNMRIHHSISTAVQTDDTLGTRQIVTWACANV